jgi:predicted  nucleic acid-binding Zn-ribbon protein
MTSATEIDLISELEKAKANVSMLESILTIEKQKDERQLSLSKSQAEVKSLTTNIQAAKTELDNLKANLTKDEEEHRAKTEEWKAKNNKIQRVIFNADVASNDSSENPEDLEGDAQLAEENAALFRQ